VEKVCEGSHGWVRVNANRGVVISTRERDGEEIDECRSTVYNAESKERMSGKMIGPFWGEGGGWKKE